LRIVQGFLQLLRFGVSGILGVAISTVLFYGFRARLPVIIIGLGPWVWFYSLNVYDMAFYILTTIIGGTVHFMVSKTWVFQK
jgi:hypothetical protein